MDYAQAVAALYQAPLGEFVADRKRLAAELKTRGDKDGAKTLAKLARPPISAWAVNQLYWHARDDFDRLMATAARLREGELGASPAHREALAILRQRAAAMIEKAGHAATEATLRRTAQTLAALAALGTFAPDPPGALATDRDPPGFEAAGVLASVGPSLSVVADDATSDPVHAAAKPARHLSAVPAASSYANGSAPIVKRARHLSAVPLSPVAEDRGEDEDNANANDEDEDQDQSAERARIAAARHAAAEHAERAERARIEEEKRRARERDRLTTVLRTARGEVEVRLRAADHLRADLQRAEAAVGEAVAIVDDLERALAALDE